MEYANEQFRVRHDVEGDLSQHKVYDFWSYEGSRLQWDARLAKIRRDNGSHKYTVRFKNEQGRIVAWDIVAYIIYDYFQEREIVWFFGRDVTQRIEHENKVKVKEMNSILECILNNIPVYLFVKDRATSSATSTGTGRSRNIRGFRPPGRSGIPITRFSPARRMRSISARTT